MAKIYKTQDIVEIVLRHYPATRGDDYLLVYKVLTCYVDPSISYGFIMTHHVELNLPSFVTIVRCRRKLQLEHKELMDDKAQKIRNDEEEEYRDYALNG